MSYLLRWVNEEGRLSQPVQNLEGEFANGLKFVELLHNAGVINADVLPQVHRMHTLEVYELITQALDSINAVYKPSLIGLVASGARGGASALIMSIKTALELKEKNSKKSKKKGLNHNDTSDMSSSSKQQLSASSNNNNRNTGTVRTTKEPFSRLPVTQEGKDDFLERTISAHPSAFENNSNKNPFTEVDMAVHLRKFHDFQRKEEANVILKEETQAMESEIGRKIIYDEIHKEKRYRACMDRDHEDQLEEQWRLNQASKLERERSQLRYELALQERRSIKALIKQKNSTNETIAGFEDFELNLRRLGIGDGDGNSNDLTSSSSESAMDFLRRLEETERNASMSKEEAFVMKEGISMKVKAARTARHERERRRRKMLVDQLSAQKQAEEAHAATKEMESLLKEGKKSRLAGEAAWKKMKLEKMRANERQDKTVQRIEYAKEGASKAMDKLTEEARANYDKTRSERLSVINARAIETGNKRQARHNRAVDLCSDVVDGLFFLVFAVIDKRLELKSPLVLTDWLKLRKQFVQDTIRPSPPKPPPPLSPEEHVCLTLDKLAFSTLSGGYKVENQTPMQANGFEADDLISKYEKVLTDLAGAIRHKEHHKALPDPRMTAAWTAYPQPFPYKVPKNADTIPPLEQIQPTPYPPKQPMRVRVCIIPDPVISAHLDISAAPWTVAKLANKMSTGNPGSTSGTPVSRGNGGANQKRFSFSSEVSGDFDQSDDPFYNQNHQDIPSEEAVTNAVSVLGHSLEIASSDPSIAMDASLLAYATDAMSKAQQDANNMNTESNAHASTTGTTTASSSGAAATHSKNKKDHDKAANSSQGAQTTHKVMTYEERLALIGASAQLIVTETEEKSAASSSAPTSPNGSKQLESLSVPIYPPALIALAVFYHLASQGGDVKPRRIVRSTDQAVMDQAINFQEDDLNDNDQQKKKNDEEDNTTTNNEEGKESGENGEDANTSSLQVESGRVSPTNDTRIKVGKKWARRWRRAAPKPVRGWVVSNFPRSPLEAKIFDYLLSRGPNGDEGECNIEYETLINEACPALRVGKGDKGIIPSATKRDDGSFEDVLPGKKTLPQIDGVFWLTGNMETKEAPPVMLEGSRFSNFARVSTLVKTAASTFKNMVALSKNNPELAAEKRLKREKEYSEKLLQEKIGQSAEEQANSVLDEHANEGVMPTPVLEIPTAPTIPTPSTTTAGAAGNGKKGSQVKGKKGQTQPSAQANTPQVPQLSAEEHAQQASAQQAQLLIEKNTIFAKKLALSLEEAQGLKLFYDKQCNGTFAQHVSTFLATTTEKPSITRRFSMKKEVDVRRTSTRSLSGSHPLSPDGLNGQSNSRRSSHNEGDDVGGGLIMNLSSPIGQYNGEGGDKLSYPTSPVSRGAGGMGGSHSRNGSFTEGGGGMSRRSSIRDDGVIRRGGLRDGPSRRHSNARLSQEKAIQDELLNNNDGNGFAHSGGGNNVVARFSSVVEILEIVSEAASARRLEWDKEAAYRLAYKLSEMEKEKKKIELQLERERQELEALEEKDKNDKINSKNSKNNKDKSSQEVKKTPAETTSKTTTTDTTKKNNGKVESFVVRVDTQESNDEGGDLYNLNHHQSSHFNQSHHKPLIDEMEIIEMRQYRRRSVLSVVGKTWLKFRREGSTCMPEGERAVRRPLERWKNTLFRCNSIESTACFDMIKLESSISKLKPQMAWSAACAVRSPDGDSTGRVASLYLEKLKLQSSSNMSSNHHSSLVGDLEVDLGDVASNRYENSLEGLRFFSMEAMRYAEKLSQAAAQAASEIALNEVQRVAASEYFLFDYFNDIKGLPLALENIQSNNQEEEEPTSPVSMPFMGIDDSPFDNHINNEPISPQTSPKPIMLHGGQLGSIKKTKSIFLSKEDSHEEENYNNDQNQNVNNDKPSAIHYLNDCLKALKSELNQANFLNKGTVYTSNFESALRALSPSSAPSSSLLDVKDLISQDSGANGVYYDLHLEELKRSEYDEALLIIRIKGCEYLRGAVARAAKLQIWAKAAAEEAAGLPLNMSSSYSGNNQTNQNEMKVHEKNVAMNKTQLAQSQNQSQSQIPMFPPINKSSTSNMKQTPPTRPMPPTFATTTCVTPSPPSCLTLGPLAHIIEARTKAEHRAVAACARHLRHIANDTTPEVNNNSAGSRRLSGSGNNNMNIGNRRTSNVVGSRGSMVPQSRNSMASSSGQGSRISMSGSMSGYQTSQNNQNHTQFDNIAPESLPLMRALQRVVTDGGPLKSIGVFDGIFIPDPSVGVDLGTSALSLSQVSHLIDLLGETSKRHFNNQHTQKHANHSYSNPTSPMNNNGNNEVDHVLNSPSSVYSPNSSTASETHSLTPTTLSGLSQGMSLSLAEVAFAQFAGSAKLEGRARKAPLPSVWSNPKIVSTLAEVFHSPPWIPPRPNIHTNNSLNHDENNDENSNNITEGKSSSPRLYQLPPPSQLALTRGLPWRELAHHLAVSVMASIPPYQELMAMASRFKAKKVGTNSSSSEYRVLITKNDALMTHFFFDDAHGQRRPSYPHLDFIHIKDNGGGVAALNSSDTSNDNMLVNNNNNDASPRSQLNSASGGRVRPTTMEYSRSNIKTLKALYITSFQQETGVRLIAADAMLLTLAYAPSPVLSSGFSDGLFRAASVAAILHPCDHPCLTNNNNSSSSDSGNHRNTTISGAVSDISFESTYSTGNGNGSNDSYDLKSIKQNHNPKNKHGVVLSRKAVEMLLCVTPPPCGRIGTAASVGAFLDEDFNPSSFSPLIKTSPSSSQQQQQNNNNGSISQMSMKKSSQSYKRSIKPQKKVNKRSCITFEEFSQRSDVQQWCLDGWFRLRDLSTVFAQLRAEQ